MNRASSASAGMHTPTHTHTHTYTHIRTHAHTRCSPKKSLVASTSTPCRQSKKRASGDVCLPQASVDRDEGERHGSSEHFPPSISSPSCMSLAKQSQSTSTKSPAPHESWIEKRKLHSRTIRRLPVWVSCVEKSKRMRFAMMACDRGPSTEHEKREAYLPLRSTRSTR